MKDPNLYINPNGNKPNANNERFFDVLLVLATIGGIVVMCLYL